MGKKKCFKTDAQMSGLYVGSSNLILAKSNPVMLRLWLVAQNHAGLIFYGINQLSKVKQRSLFSLNNFTLNIFSENMYI